MADILQAILIIIAITVILFIIWVFIPRKGVFKKIANGIEHVIDSITSGFP